MLNYLPISLIKLTPYKSHPWVENAKKMVEMGCHMIEMGHDATILRTIWSKKGEDIRKLK